MKYKRKALFISIKMIIIIFLFTHFILNNSHTEQKSLMDVLGTH